jgi:hypothetical protein
LSSENESDARAEGDELMSKTQNDHTPDPPIQRDGNAGSPEPDEGAAIVVAGASNRDEESVVEEEFGPRLGTGRTYQPQKAAEEGLSYTPPRDPATVPSEDDRQGSEVAAGFAPSMEDTDPDVQILPDGIDSADLEIQEDIGLALRYNSETAHLRDLSALVNRGVVSLYGTVPTEDDIAMVYTVVSDLEGVVKVISHLEVEG